MISLKVGIIMAAMFAAGAFLAPPVQQAIAAVIATDVQCTGCVGTSDVAGNAITAVAARIHAQLRGALLLLGMNKNG